MKLIVGLGNPDQKFSKNRHNAGFIFVESLAEDRGLAWTLEKKFEAEIAADKSLMLVKPQTFMNRSGDAVSKLVNFFKINLNDLIVVHDDVDLEPGETKFKKSTSSAGHHGVESIMEKLGSQDFWRLRIGVGRPDTEKFDVEDYVLGNLTEKEIENIKNLTKTTTL